MIVTCQIQAQKEYALYPFEDYRNCTSGLLNEEGDTIWPAQFDKVIKPLTNDGFPAQCWIAEYHGNWGLLSSEGTIVLPFEFSDIKMSFEKDVYQVTKNQKIGIYNKEGKELYPLTIDEIEVEYGHALVFVQDGKFGLFGTGMTLTLKPIYDFIEQTEFYNYDKDGYHISIYYLLEKEGMFGLSGSNGELMFDDACCPFDFLNDPEYSKIPLLRIHDSDHGAGLITLKNELLLAPEYRDLNLFSLQEENGDTVLFAAVETKEERKMAFRIDRKQKSIVYDELLVGTHALIFNGKRRKGILNAQLEEQLITTPYELRFGAHEYYFSEEMNYSPDLPFIPGSKERCVLVLADIAVEKKSHSKHDKSYGLINVNTGAKVKPQFQSIWSKTIGNEVYYFAFEQWFERDVNSIFKVYNSELEVIDAFEMNYQHMINFNEFFRPENDHPALVFMNEKGKMGAVGPNGDIVIPFIYDELSPQYFDMYDRKRTLHLAARIDKKSGTIDWQGKELIPVEFDFVQAFPYNFQIAAKPNGYVLYDSLYRKVIQDCQYITYARSSSLKHYHYQMNPKLRDHAFYAVKNDTAFAYFKDGFKVLNEQHINHDVNSTGLTLMGGRLLIEKSGKCILFKDHLLWASPTVYYFQQLDSICIFHIDKGVTVCVKRASVSTSIDSYIHVKQHPNKEGLISKVTGEWVLEPNDYFQILTDGKKGIHSTTDHFWYVMKGNEGLSNSMWIYDRQEKGKLDRKFDVPMMNLCGEYSIARSGGKFGMLDKDYLEALPFEYKNIIYSHKQFFVKGFNNRWSAWTPENGLIPLNCNDVSLSKFTNGRLIFDGERVAIISNSFEYLMPFTGITDLPDTLSLTKLLGPMNYSSEITDWNRSFTEEHEAIGRIYNNITIIDLSLIFSTRYQLTEIPYLQNKTNSLQPVLIDEISYQKYEKRTLSFIGKRLCSYVEKSTRRNKSRYLPYNNYKNYTMSDEVTINRTMVLEGKLLRPATLQDLFLENFNYISWLDEYLTQVINQKQLFGLQCMNLPAILDEYKQNFYLERAGISFSLKNDNKAILIPWVDLKGKIKTM